MHDCVRPCLPVPFPGLSETWFASHLQEERSYPWSYVPKSFEKTWQLVRPGLLLCCSWQREDAASHIPQRHSFSSTGKTVMGTCTLRDSDGEQNYMKSTLVSVLTELMWTSCNRNYKNTSKCSKRHSGYLAQWVHGELRFPGRQDGLESFIAGPYKPRSKSAGNIFFLERCRRAKSRGS